MHYLKLALEALAVHGTEGNKKKKPAVRTGTMMIVLYANTTSA